MLRYGLVVLVFALGCRVSGNTNGNEVGGDPEPDLTGLPADVDLTEAAPGDMAEPNPSDPTCDPLSARKTPTLVYTLPEAGEAPYVDVLKTATTSIKMTAYLMGYGGIYDTLIEKAKAGVKVQIMFDEGQTANQKYFDALTAAGAEGKWSDPTFPYFHNKYFVVDGTKAVVSTGNYSYTYSVQKERNFVAQVSDPDDVADLNTLFEADWNGTPLTMSCTRLLISPINSKDRLLDLIKSAKTTILVESMQFAELDVRAAITDAKKAGVSVRVILAAPSWIDANTDAATYLKSQGIMPRYMSKPGVHVKAIIVDGKAAYMGSENLSYTSLTKNREVGLFITETDGVTQMSNTFETDWAGATAF